VTSTPADPRTGCFYAFIETCQSLMVHRRMATTRRPLGTAWTLVDKAPSPLSGWLFDLGTTGRFWMLVS